MDGRGVAHQNCNHDHCLLHPKGSTKCICANGSYDNFGQNTCLIEQLLKEPRAKSWFENGLPANSYDKIKKSISNGVLKNLETKTDIPVPDSAKQSAVSVQAPQAATTPRYTGQLQQPARAQSAKGVEKAFTENQIEAAVAAERMRIMTLMMAQQQYAQQMGQPMPLQSFGNYMPDLQGQPVRRQGVLPPMMQGLPRGRGPPNPNPGP